MSRQPSIRLCFWGSRQDGEAYKLQHAVPQIVSVTKHFNSPVWPRLYLFNFDSLRLIGTFVSNGAPGMSLVPGAFNGKFSAHIKVAKQIHVVIY